MYKYGENYIVVLVICISTCYAIFNDVHERSNKIKFVNTGTKSMCYISIRKIMFPSFCMHLNLYVHASCCFKMYSKFDNV